MARCRFDGHYLAGTRSPVDQIIFVNPLLTRQTPPVIVSYQSVPLHISQKTTLAGT